MPASKRQPLQGSNPSPLTMTSFLSTQEQSSRRDIWWEIRISRWSSAPTICTTTAEIARIATEQARILDRKIAVVGVGGLSGSFFRHEIEIADDHIATDTEDKWNRKILDLVAAGDIDTLQKLWPDYSKEARVDMGFKHMSFILGALGNRYGSAELLEYGPLYGTGAAVIHFSP